MLYLPPEIIFINLCDFLDLHDKFVACILFSMYNKYMICLRDFSFNKISKQKAWKLDHMSQLHNIFGSDSYMSYFAPQLNINP